MKEKIASKMEALFCPPEGIKATGGEQLNTGNKYPDVKNVDMLKHVSGEKTFALDCDFGDSECKFGVIDVDELNLDVVLEIEAYLQEKGISTAKSFSGNKGYHVYVLSETVPLVSMINFLKKVKGQFKFKGEAIPGDAFRCKPAPCLHQVAGNMSYLFRNEPYQEYFGKDEVPEGFWESQLEILESLEVTSANTLIKLAVTDEKKEKDLQNMIPDLEKIQDGHPLCIERFIQNGGSNKLETYDKNNLALASYCVSRGLDEKAAIEMAKELARNSENGPVVTTKTLQGKVDHFKSILGSPSVKDNAFNCASMLKARSELKFNCDRCKARPAGVKVNMNTKNQVEDNTFKLEKVLAEQLVTYIVNHGNTTEDIAWQIMPYDNSTKKYEINLLGLLIKAVSEGVTTETKLAKWIDQESEESESFISNYFSANAINELREYLESNPQEQFRKVKNYALRIWNRMLKKETVSSDKFQEILDRAVDISMRYRIDLEAQNLRNNTTNPGKDIFAVSSEFTQNSTRVLNSSQKGSVQSIQDQGEQLIDYLLSENSGNIETPFPELNQLLGGGLDNGKLYIPVSPPGGGKTTLASHIADHAAANETPVLFVSMEMSMEQLFINCLSRTGDMNSAKVANPLKYDGAEDQVGEAANKYIFGPGKYMYIYEGNSSTCPGRIEALISMVRAEQGLTREDPFLVVIDYLQLLNTGNEKLDLNPNETIKISDLAVKCKQLARDHNVAVMAISDVTKEEQKNTYTSKEFTLNSLRGSNRIAHAADTVIALYSESSAEDGGKAKEDPWDLYINKVKNSEKASEFVKSAAQTKENTTLGGDKATAFARIELLKNRAGQGKGSQFVLYHRAHHKFEPVHLEGQRKAEGRG